MAANQCRRSATRRSRSSTSCSPLPGPFAPSVPAIRIHASRSRAPHVSHQDTRRGPVGRRAYVRSSLHLGISESAEAAATGENPPMQPGRRPIFILGMMRRSGTNYLSDLLLQHPDCVSAAPVHEDHLVQRAGHLRRYVDAVSGSWTRPGACRRRARPGCSAHSAPGSSTTSSGAGRRRARVVTKTPRIENLDRYFDLFPWRAAAAPRPRRPQRGRLERAQLRPERGVDPAGVGERGAGRPRVRRPEPWARTSVSHRSLRRSGREARTDDDGESCAAAVSIPTLRLRRGRALPLRGSSTSATRCRRALGAGREGRHVPAERTLARLDALSARPFRGRSPAMSSGRWVTTSTGTDP